MAKREKRLLYIIIVLLIGVICKSIFFDGANVTGDELKFKQFVEQTVENEDRYNSWLKRLGISSYKIVSVKKIDSKGDTSILVKGNDGRMKAEKIKGQYLAKIRGYIFHVIPYSEFRIKSQA